VFSNVDVNKSFNVFFKGFLKLVSQWKRLRKICTLISGSQKELKFNVSGKSICIWWWELLITQT
jgi:hypothetical protein